MRTARRLAAVGVLAGVILALTQLLAPPGELPEGFVYGVDSYGGITYDQAVQMKQAGVEVYVQALTALPFSGIMQPPTRVEALRNAYEAGLTIAGYALVGAGDNMTGANYIDFARSGVPDDLWDALAFVAVDFEVPSASYEVVVGALDRTQELGKGRVLYTNYNSWVNYLGNPAIPPDTRLWNAYWDNHADLDYGGLQFGGLGVGDVLGEQWSGAVQEYGLNVDRDIFRLDVLGLPPVPTPEPTPVLLPSPPSPTPPPAPSPPTMPPIRPPCCCYCSH